MNLFLLIKIYKFIKFKQVLILTHFYNKQLRYLRKLKKIIKNYYSPYKVGI